MNNNLKAVFFDLGNVLVDFDHLRAVRKITRLTSLKEDQIYNVVFDSNIVALFEEGKIQGKDFFVRFKDIFKLKIAYADFLDIWNDIFFITPRNKLVQDTAKELKNQYKIFLISNVNILHFEYINFAPLYYRSM